MKKKTISSLIGLLLSTSAVSAAPISIYADDVVTTANRLPEKRNNVIGDISVISREDIERAGQSTFAELLQSQAGVEIESNGGVGSLSNIRLRGTNIQSVVILIDGMRLSSAANGLTNISQLVLDQIDRVEILRGAASGLYGSDAIGGVIQIFTRQGSQKTRASVSAGYGSNNTTQTSASISGKINDTSYSLGIGSITTNGISALNVRSGKDADRDSYRNLSVNANILQKISEGHTLGLQLFGNEGRLDLDGSNFPAYQKNRQQLIALNSSNQLTDYWLSNFKIGETIDTANAVGSYGISNTRSKQKQTYWQNQFVLPKGNLLLAYDRIEDNIDATTNYSVDRRINNGYLASYQVNNEKHAFNIAAREDHNSQFGNHATGSIKYAFNVNEYWKVSTIYGTAFRAPTFNDLYWPYQDYGDYGTYEGNAQLKPETSRNKEIILAYDQGHHRVSATVFENKVKNLIVGTQGLFNDSPINIGSATIQGLTIAYEGWFSNFHLRANADFQDPSNDDQSGKILARRAKEHGSIWLGQTWGDLEIGYEVVASGKRFNDVDNDIKLAGYSLINLTASYKLSSEWALNARVNNLLDKDYTLASYASAFNPNAAAFNTMGSNLFVSLRYSPSF
jgi:vitamin B12 transporter